MAAVVRIKRQLNEDPLDALLLNCKRRKTDTSQAEEEQDLSAVLKFAGTVDTPDEDVFKHIKKPTKAETEEQYKKHTTDIISKLRLQKQASAKNSRYKVVSSFRSNGPETLQSAESSLNCTIVDIEAEEKEDSKDKATSSDDSTKFVYDLYYTNSDDFGDADLNELVSVYPLSDGVIYDMDFDQYRNESDIDGSEDSNAESNWRNDYPDESDVESPEEHDDDSITEVDMLRAMNRVDLYDEDNISSDDYNDSAWY